MESYLHLFETEQEFDAQYEGPGYTEPWVSFTIETSAVTFNKGGGHDYSQDYFTFEILTGGNISWSYYDGNESVYTDATKTIYYSKNDGGWTVMPRTLSVDAGDVIRFKGDNSGYSNDEYNYNSFANSTAVFNAKGNIMSLINSSNFTSLTALTADYTFCQFMGGCQVIDASNLVLPARTLTDYCYDEMFRSCTSLTSAPELPATALAQYCYRGMFSDCINLTSAPELPAEVLTNNCYEFMFNGCSNLSYIKCLATDKSSAYDCTYNWVGEVSSTGTFVTPSSAQWETNSDGIPTGWTRVNV